jgi:GxxExxY protein
MSGGSAIISGKWWEIGRISPGEWERPYPPVRSHFFSMIQNNHKVTKSTKAAPSFYLDQLARSVIGAALVVHRALGPGFLESVYESALTIELQSRSIPYKTQVRIPLYYQSQVIGESRLDLVIDDLLIVELKCVEVFTPIHTAQVISYLKASKCKLGLLINFNVPLLKQGIRRIIY